MTSNIAQQALALHNKYRALHNSSPLTWCPELQRRAQGDATSMLVTGLGLEPRGTIIWGRNVFQLMNQKNEQGFLEILDEQTALERAIDSWYETGQHFDPSQPWSPKCRHFSQLAWPESVRLGIGIARKKTDFFINYFVVAYYDPPGELEMPLMAPQPSAPQNPPDPIIETVGNPQTKKSEPIVKDVGILKSGKQKGQPIAPPPASVQPQNMTQAKQTPSVGKNNNMNGSQKKNEAVAPQKDIQKDGGKVATPGAKSGVSKMESSEKTSSTSWSKKSSVTMKTSGVKSIGKFT